jgi:hypothetical protein
MSTAHPVHFPSHPSLAPASDSREWLKWVAETFRTLVNAIIDPQAKCIYLLACSRNTSLSSHASLSTRGSQFLSLFIFKVLTVRNLNILEFTDVVGKNVSECRGLVLKVRVLRIRPGFLMFVICVKVIPSSNKTVTSS